MLVTFDPFINNTATPDARYVNFLRCVTAICTAAAGTTELTVNPYVNNTGTTDETKNCIVSINANTEAGGWTTSASHLVPDSATFASMTTKTTFALQYKADFYNSSGKGTLPFNKLCFHSHGTNVLGGMVSGEGSGSSGYIASTPMSSWTTTCGQIEMTFGCNDVNDLSSGGFVPIWFNAVPNQQTTSWTNNAYWSNGLQSSTQPYSRTGFNVLNQSGVYYQMSVTKDYCVIWEVNRNSSYTAGYSTTTSTGINSAPGSPTYGHLMYGGLRTTQTWEDSLNFNPPWVTFHTIHIPQSASASYTVPNPASSACAYMATINETGIISGSASKVKSGPFGMSTLPPADYLFNVNNGNLTGPLYWHNQRVAIGPQAVPNLPSVDPVTGLLVPCANPIQFSATRLASAWNLGGNARGIFKSLTCSLATMKLYWLENQTFTIGSDEYLPIVFNEDMYLVRLA